jgi:hypothetical protein
MPASASSERRQIRKNPAGTAAFEKVCDVIDAAPLGARAERLAAARAGT